MVGLLIAHLDEIIFGVVVADWLITDEDLVVMYCGGAGAGSPHAASYKYDAQSRCNNTHSGVLKAPYIQTALYYPHDENHWPQSILYLDTPAF